ncbi:MAG: hypothetical protein RIR22_612 [Planctomycetota bacterium]|jgi:hypothetical protein
MESPIFVFSCSFCEGTLRTKITNIGKRFSCPKCKNMVLVQNKIKSEEELQIFESDDTSWEHKPTLINNRTRTAIPVKSNFNGAFVFMGIGMCALIMCGTVFFIVLNDRPKKMTFSSTATAITPKQETVFSKASPPIPEQPVPERKPPEVDPKVVEFREAQESFKKYADSEIEIIRNSPSNIKNEVMKSGGTAIIKTIFDPTYNAYLDSSIGEKPIKGIIRISGRTEGSLGSIKLPGQSFTLKFECEMQGFSWKVVSSKREN